jgi:nitrous oxidase accessory protein
MKPGKRYRLEMKRMWICIVCIVLLPGGFFSPVTADAATLVVGVDFPTIGAALEAAKDGDLIKVAGGSYAERLTIDKKVHLKGIDDPVIHIPSGDMVKITHSDVVFEGFTLSYDTSGLGASDTAIRIVKGADRVTVRDNRLSGVMFGIWNVEGRDLRIEGNTITGIGELDKGRRGNCINLTGSQKVHATDNTLTDCRDGIYMELCHDATITGNEISDSRYSVHTMWVDRGDFSRNTAHDNLVGLAIMYTKNSEIRDNLSYGNKTHGILMIQAVKGEVSGNKVIGNTKGIFLYNSIYNRISSNIIMNNQLGIHCWGGSEDNEVIGNSFINNEIQLKYVAGKDQVWDGNYWSDYIGWDTTGDGTGDYSYESNSIVDHIIWRYPLAKVLYSSPSLQMLWMLEKQFPLFDIPKVVDNKPLMVPLHDEWIELMETYSDYKPDRIYGEIEKLEHVPGGTR